MCGYTDQLAAGQIILADKRILDKSKTLTRSCQRGKLLSSQMKKRQQPGVEVACL
ncbi:hypothetical protein D3C73_811720 [compost metagenome]